MKKRWPTKPVYVYMIPKENWPNKVRTIQLNGAYNYTSPVFVDLNARTGECLGYEILKAHSVTINGK